MVADIARVTYDPTRQYRSVIWQQGRVTLEADNNEAAALEGEALRLETIDIIGPTGTPDNGYAVGSGKGPGGVTIGKGTFYLGGWRLELDAEIDLSKQPDWLDAPAFKTEQGNLVVSLLLTEQSVCAVEDQALREVALGGPDSAARGRLMQHFLRTPTDGATCAAGWTTILGLLEEDGVTVNPDTLQLESTAQLQAGFVKGQHKKDPCKPSAAGGYLGADNQMVRVTVVKYDATAKTGTLLWGWNNASLLYRATMSDPLTLTLTTMPVDQEHAPQQNQFVEILRTEADLQDGNYIADGQGFVVKLAKGYSVDTQQIVLNAALPAAYQNNEDPLFVRLWQSEVNFNAGKATPLDNVSGITVAITMDALPSHIAARPFWHFAVRPSKPQNIYPQRYADAPQPPDGPRQWITDLAVVAANEKGSKLLADCRVPFLPLTQQTGGCCGLVLGPDDVSGRGGLQAIVDSLAGSAAVLSLRTGIYKLSAPLKLTKQHAGLTIEGCTDRVYLEAAGDDLTPFRLGLIYLDGVTNLTLRQLAIEAPAVPLTATGDTIAKAKDEVQVTTMIGILARQAEQITIDSCNFALKAPSDYTFGGGFVVLGPTSQVTLTENRFTGSNRAAELFGILAIVTRADASAELDQWEIVENRFKGLMFGTVGFAQLGLVNCRANIVTECGTGFVFAEANLGQANSFTNEALKQSDAAGTIDLGQAANVTMRPDLLATMVDKVAPIQAALPSLTTTTTSDAARKVLSDQLKSSGVDLYKNLAGQASAAAPASPAEAARTGAAAPQATIDQASFDKLGAVAIEAELLERTLTPALRFEDNEITLNAAGSNPWVGLGLILSPDEPGSVIATGNRVVVPDATTVACGMLFPEAAVVTGNLFAQLAAAPDGTKGTWCLILISRSPAIMVGANVASFFELVLPARASPAATTSWEFLNTTG